MSKKELVIILSITFGVIMAWLVFDILHSKPSVVIDPKLTELLEPIDVSLDKEVITQINQNFNELNQTPVFRTEEIPQPIPTPVVSPVPDISVPASTDSAALDNEINAL